MFALAGCYERVVGGSGPDYDGPVYEPNLKDERAPIDDIEDALLGPKKPVKGRPKYSWE